MFATVNKRLTFCNACTQLGFSEEDVYDDNNGKKEEKVGKVEDASVKLQTDEEEDISVDNEGDVEVFAEGKSNSSDDEEDLRTEKVMMSKTMIGL